MSYKALVIGVISYLLGYGACLILAYALPGELFTPQWFLIAALVMLIPVASGSLAARITNSKPLIHGALTGLIGTAGSLTIVILGLSVSTTWSTVVAWLAGAAALGLLGALLFGRPRVGP